MQPLVSIDGVIVPAKDATISVFDRGFLYGDSVFEVYRSYGSLRFLEAEHLARLARSAAIVGIALPIELEALASEIEALHRASGLEDAYLRVILSRGEGPLGIDPRSAYAPRRVLIAAPLELPAASLYEEGAALITLSSAAPRSYTGAAGAKASNYLASILAHQEARARGAHEALLIDGSGAILEGATSNFFIVRAGALYTPALESGILPGITRALVLELARDLGLGVHESAITLEELAEADEAFITSSIREIMPVRSVDGAAIGIQQARIRGRSTGPTTDRLREAYRARIEGARDSNASSSI